MLCGETGSVSVDSINILGPADGYSGDAPAMVSSDRRPAGGEVGSG